MIRRSALYAGTVAHRRVWPRRHQLAYRCFWLLLDLDEAAKPGFSGWLLGINRMAVMSVRDTDHGNGSGEPLRAQVARLLAASEISSAPASVQLLTMPRVLGYVFNPLSVYFCRDAQERLFAIIYEVNNTFGERRAYVLPVAPDAPTAAKRPIRQSCAKDMYVSPFNGTDMTYAFSVVPPEETMRVAITTSDAERTVLYANMTGERRALAPRHLLRALVTVPFAPLKVITAIHWEALRLWLKGVPLHPRPSPRGHPIATSTTTSLADRPHV